MSGLSTASFIDGGMRGFQFGENIKDQRQMRGLRDAQALRQEQQFSMAEQSHADQLKTSEQLRAQRASHEERAGRAEGRETERHQATLDANKDARKLNQQQQELNRYRIDDIKGDTEEKLHRARALKMRALQDAGVEVDDESLELFDRVSRRADPEYLLSKPVVNAVDVAKKVFAGEIDHNAPEALEALGLIYDEIGRGATDGRQVKPSRLAPAEDGEGFYVGLDVTNPDGKKSSGALTVNRSADPKDPVRKITFDEIMPVVMAMDEEQQKLSDPRYVEAYMKRYAPADVAASKGTTTLIQNTEYLRRLFPDKSNEELIAYSNSAKENPDAFNRWYVDTMEARAEQAMIPPKNRKSVKELMNEARKISQPEAGAERGGGSPRTAPPAALQYLKENPEQAQLFQQKYGYLPEGF